MGKKKVKQPPLHRASQEVEETIRADHAWLREHPERTCLVRTISPVERVEFRSVLDESLPTGSIAYIQSVGSGFYSYGIYEPGLEVVPEGCIGLFGHVSGFELLESEVGSPLPSTARGSLPGGLEVRFFRADINWGSQPKALFGAAVALSEGAGLPVHWQTFMITEAP